MRRAVANLVDNAVRYSTAGIEVCASQADGVVSISVLDRGPGIQTMDTQAVIKPFVREDVSRGLQPGAGLGLSIVDQIARAHGGRMSIANRAGGGLTVVISVPLT
jgi:two-component system osmolarity sensor histidine kinase EnvZ